MRNARIHVVYSNGWSYSSSEFISYFMTTIDNALLIFVSSVLVRRKGFHYIQWLHDSINIWQPLYTYVTYSRQLTRSEKLECIWADRDQLHIVENEEVITCVSLCGSHFKMWEQSVFDGVHLETWIIHKVVCCTMQYVRCHIK